jgi:hypothetical protein
MDTMIRVLQAGSGRLSALVLVDLPIDLIAVLEQQERADQVQRPEQVPRER